MNSNPTCFISYSWDSDAHKDWVRKLGEILQAHGVVVRLDQWDCKLGNDLVHYMEHSIRDSDFVLLICTPRFAEKANLGHGGVGYEKMIVTGEIFTGQNSPNKFVPLLREGTQLNALPSYLKAKVFVDFRDDGRLESSVTDLLRHLHNMPAHQRPLLGKVPRFPSPSPAGHKDIPEPPQLHSMYCSRCGVAPGQKSLCIGKYSEHSFTGFSGTVYCQRCGIRPGQKESCVGDHWEHIFKGYSGPVCCERCGVRPGQKSTCVGAHWGHAFVDS